MAQYFWTAANYSIGVTTPNNDGTLDKMPNGGVASLTIDEIIDDVDGLRYWHTDSGSDAIVWWHYKAAGSDSNLEIYAMWKGGGFRPTAGLAFRRSDGAGYSFKIGYNIGGAGSLFIYSSWSDSGTSIYSLGTTLGAGLQHIRLNIDSNGWIRMRWWLDGSPEPTTWTFEYQDITYAGPFLPIIFENRRESFWHKWGIGTAGDPAPTSAGTATVSESIALGAIATASASPTAQSSESLALSKQALVQGAQVATAQVQASLTAQGLLSTGAAAQAGESLLLGMASSVAVAARAVASAKLGLSTQASAGVGPQASVGELLALSIAAGLLLQESSGQVVSEQVLLSVAHQLGSSAVAATQATLSLAAGAGLQAGSIAAATARIELVAQVAKAVVAGAQVSDVLQLAKQAALAFATGSVIDEAIALAAQVSLQHAEVATARGSVALSYAAALTNLARGLVSLGVSLDAITSISVIDQAITTQVTLPDGRTFVVRADDRTYRIEPDDRTYRIEP